MNKIYFLLLFTILYADSPFETEKAKDFNLSVFNTKMTVENKKAMKNSQIKCRWICDKKIYKEQKIANAILFYKKSKDYK